MRWLLGFGERHLDGIVNGGLFSTLVAAFLLPAAMGWGLWATLLVVIVTGPLYGWAVQRATGSVRAAASSSEPSRR